MQTIKKFVKFFRQFNRYVIALLVIIFATLSYLSIPALYKYDSLQKELSDKILKEFNINLILSNEIKYHIFPAPNFEITNNLVTFDSKSKFDKFGEIKKVKVFISTKNLFSQKKLSINQIKLYESNFIINKSNYIEFKKYLQKKITKKIKIIDSKVFYKDEENNETLAIATIKDARIQFDEKKNSKNFYSDGLIFNTKYNIDFKQSLEKLYLKHFDINFKDLNFKISNNLFNQPNEENITGQTDISIMTEKIKVKYKLLNNDINFETDKNKNLNLFGVISNSPFFFDIKVNFQNLNTKSIKMIISKVEAFINNDYLLNKNFNGKILLNVKKVNGSKYLDKLEIKIFFKNGKISLNNSKIYLKKLGYLELKNFNIISKKNQIFIETKNLFKIDNLRQFNRVIQLPKKNQKNIENIYFEFERMILDKSFSLKKLIINNEVNKPEFKVFNLSKSLETKNINNIKNWFDLKSLLRELLIETN
tara:strand:- start:259 stop:1692 length:1434 start_codon:yes stop_codon:yes gene_type:complete